MARSFENITLHPDEKVKCPVCVYEYLEIKDIIPESDSDMFERMMSYPSCHAVNLLFLKKGHILDMIPQQMNLE